MCVRGASIFFGLVVLSFQVRATLFCDQGLAQDGAPRIFYHYADLLNEVRKGNGFFGLTRAHGGDELHADALEVSLHWAVPTDAVPADASQQRRKGEFVAQIYEQIYVARAPGDRSAVVILSGRTRADVEPALGMIQEVLAQGPKSGDAPAARVHVLLVLDARGAGAQAGRFSGLPSFVGAVLELSQPNARDTAAEIDFLHLLSRVGARSSSGFARAQAFLWGGNVRDFTRAAEFFFRAKEGVRPALFVYWPEATHFAYALDKSYLGADRSAGIDLRVLGMDVDWGGSREFNEWRESSRTYEPVPCAIVDSRVFLNSLSEVQERMARVHARERALLRFMVEQARLDAPATFEMAPGRGVLPFSRAEGRGRNLYGRSLSRKIK